MSQCVCGMWEPEKACLSVGHMHRGLRVRGCVLTGYEMTLCGACTVYMCLGSTPGAKFLCV